MSIATLVPKSWASSPTLGTSTLASLSTGNEVYTGDSDGGVCVKTASDSKYVSIPVTFTGAGGILGQIAVYFEDDTALLPPGATINSVKLSTVARTSDLGIVPQGQILYLFNGGGDTFGTPAAFSPAVGLAFTTVDLFTAQATNPVTGLAWTRIELFDDGDAGDLGSGGWIFYLLNSGTGAGSITFDVDQLQLVVNYTAAIGNTWYYNPNTEHYQFAASDPGSPWVVNDPDTTVDDTAVPEDVTDDVEAPLVDPVTDETPSATLFTPGIGCSAGGTSVAITGTGFGDGATVTFGGVAATSVVVVNHKLITCVTPAHANGAVNVVVTNLDTSTATGTGAFTYGTPWWTQFIVIIIDSHIYTFEFSVQSCDPPDTGVWLLQSITTPAFTWWFNTALGINTYQVSSPGAGFVDIGATPTPASNNGWYISPVAFGGSIQILSASRPKDPRTWENIIAWAENSTEMLGGSPAASCIFNNHIIYPSSDYTVGTTYPPIRVFDGSFDHELCKLPPTPTNGVPQAVISMLTANGTMYLTSFDSGTTSANWLGRVFQLELNSGVLTPLGTQFAAGEMPYALCWHMGRLWCGTNNGIGTVGKVYYFRPGIDTSWTLDHSVATETAGAVDSMASYKGNLYVGTGNAAGLRGKVLVRDTSGTWNTSDTGPTGTTTLNNGYISMRVFGTNLYANYWSTDSSVIRKYTGSAWSTVYTGAAATLRSYIVLFEDASKLFAIGGGMDATGALLSTPDGTTWTSLTAQLASVEGSKTLLPIYGVEIL